MIIYFNSWAKIKWRSLLSITTVLDGGFLNYNKSQENYQAIKLLMNNDLHTPVVHCAYYSSLQLIIHYTYKYSGITEEEVKKETSDKGSHNYFLSVFTKEIRNINPRNASLFYKFFSTFKRKRTEADYHIKEISEQDSNRAKENVEKIRKFLKLIDDDGKCENIYYL